MNLFQILPVWMILFLIFMAENTVAAVSARVDRSVLSMNESVRLQITQTGKLQGEPDLDKLKADFYILSKSQSQQISFINGKSSRKKVWSIHLMPKKAGELTIAPIPVGMDQTRALHLVVQKTQSAKSGSYPPIHFEVSLQPQKQAYVQQKIELLIRLKYRVPLDNMSISQLSLDNVIMQQDGQDRQFQQQDGQYTYQVIERRYALYVQKPGMLEIPPLRFEAIQAPKNRFGMGFFAQSGPPVYRQSQPLKIEILPRVVQYPDMQKWLVSEKVQLESTHSDLSQIKVGDSITITDRVIVRGVLGSLIPATDWPSIEHLKSYPDKPVTDTQYLKGEVYGIREQKTAIIPLRVGNYHIPKRAYYWFNPKTQKIEQGFFPQIDFQVSPASNQNDTGALPEQTNRNSEMEMQPSNCQALETTRISQTEKQYPAWVLSPLWFGVSLGSLLLLLVQTLWCYRCKNIRHHATQTETTEKDSEKKAWARLHKVCQQNQPKACLRAFIHWAELYFARDQLQPVEIYSLIDKDSALYQQLQLLEQHLYTDQGMSEKNLHAQNWQGRRFMTALKQFREQSEKQIVSTASIKPLHPFFDK